MIKDISTSNNKEKSINEIEQNDSQIEILEATTRVKVTTEMVLNYIEEYKEIVNKLKKFVFGKWYTVPKDKNKMFKIINVDPKTNNIVFEYKRTMTQKFEQGSLPYERFNLFLYHPELF